MSEYPLITLKKEDSAPGQRITHIMLEVGWVSFWRAKWGDSSNSINALNAPYSCIAALIQEIKKGTLQDIVGCEETEQFRPTEPEVYDGARISNDLIYLEWHNPKVIEVISRKYLERHGDKILARENLAV